MSEAPSPRREPSKALLPAFAAAGLQVAVVVALWGIIALAVDRDAIDYPDAGPILGPAIVIAGAAVTFLAVRSSLSASAPPFVDVVSAVLATVGAFVAMVVVGASGYSLTRGDVGWMPVAAAHLALSPFVIGAALTAGPVAAATHWLVSFDRRRR